MLEARTSLGPARGDTRSDVDRDAADALAHLLAFPGVEAGTISRPKTVRARTGRWLLPVTSLQAEPRVVIRMVSSITIRPKSVTRTPPSRLQQPVDVISQFHLLVYGPESHRLARPETPVKPGLSGGGDGNRTRVHSNKISQLALFQVPQQCLTDFRTGIGRLASAPPSETPESSLPKPPQGAASGPPA